MEIVFNISVASKAQDIIRDDSYIYKRMKQEYSNSYKFNPSLLDELLEHLEYCGINENEFEIINNI